MKLHTQFNKYNKWKGQRESMKKSAHNWNFCFKFHQKIKMPEKFHSNEMKCNEMCNGIVWFECVLLIAVADAMGESSSVVNVRCARSRLYQWYHNCIVIAATVAGCATWTNNKIKLKMQEHAPSYVCNCVYQANPPTGRTANNIFHAIKHARLRHSTNKTGETVRISPTASWRNSDSEFARCTLHNWNGVPFPMLHFRSHVWCNFLDFNYSLCLNGNAKISPQRWMSHIVHDTNLHLELVQLLNSIMNDVESVNVWFIHVCESVWLVEFFPSIRWCKLFGVLAARKHEHR